MQVRKSHITSTAKPTSAAGSVMVPSGKSFQHRLHTRNSGISAALVRPAHLSSALIDLLNEECAPILGDDPIQIETRNTCEDDVGGSEIHIDKERPMIEMANVSSSNLSALSPSLLARNPFSPCNDSFRDFSWTEATSPHAQGETEVDLVGSTGPAVSSSRTETKGARGNERGSDSTSTRHALDGVIIVSNDGVPMCIEDRIDRSMPVADVPDEQDAENLAFLKQLGLALREQSHGS